MSSLLQTRTGSYFTGLWAPSLIRKLMEWGISYKEGWSGEAPRSTSEPQGKKPRVEVWALGEHPHLAADPVDALDP